VDAIPVSIIKHFLRWVEFIPTGAG
jgi:hypothetical protein